MKWTFETETAQVEYEDSGQAAIVEVDDGSDDDYGPFVRLHSWRAETREHPFIDALVGKRVRVTVEVIEAAPRERAKSGGKS